MRSLHDQKTSSNYDSWQENTTAVVCSRNLTSQLRWPPEASLAERTFQEKLRSRNKLHSLLWALHPLSIRFLLWVAMFFFFGDNQTPHPFWGRDFLSLPSHNLHSFRSEFQDFIKMIEADKERTLEHHSIPSRRIGQYLSKNASKKNCWELTATSNKAACRGMYLVCTWVNALILCYISKNGSRFKGLETETWQKQSQCSHLLEGPLECLCQDCYSLGESPHRRGVRKGSKASAAYGGESSMVPPCPTPPILCWR